MAKTYNFSFFWQRFNEDALNYKYFSDHNKGLA